MAVSYVLDEQLRGVLWQAVVRHNRISPSVIDVIRVGDRPDLPLGMTDPDVLLWAERNQRILISDDRTTMGAHFVAHLAGGHHSPGVFMLVPHAEIRDVLDFLVLAAYASEPNEWVDRIEYFG